MPAKSKVTESGNPIGNRVRLTRVAMGLSVQKLADKANVGRVTVIRLEDGNLGMTLKNFLKVCRALKVKPSNVLEGL